MMVRECSYTSRMTSIDITLGGEFKATDNVSSR